MSNCITDALETCKDNGLEPKYFYLFVYNFSLVFKVFINIHECANYKHVTIFERPLTWYQSQRSRISISWYMIDFIGLCPFFRIT